VRQSKAAATRVPARGARVATRAVTEPEATATEAAVVSDEAPGRRGLCRNHKKCPCSLP